MTTLTVIGEYQLYSSFFPHFTQKPLLFRDEESLFSNFWCRDAAIYLPSTGEQLINKLPLQGDFAYNEEILTHYALPYSSNWAQHKTINTYATASNEAEIRTYAAFLTREHQKIRYISSFLEGGNVYFAGVNQDRAIVGRNSVILTAHTNRAFSSHPYQGADISDEAYWGAWVETENLDISQSTYEKLKAGGKLSPFFTPEQKQKLKPIAAIFEGKYREAEALIKKELKTERIAFVPQLFFHIDLQLLPWKDKVFAHSLLAAKENIEVIYACNSAIGKQIDNTPDAFFRYETETRKKIEAIGLEYIPVAGAFSHQSEENPSLLAPLNGLVEGDTIYLNHTYTSEREKHLIEITKKGILPHIDTGRVVLCDRKNSGVEEEGGIHCLTNTLCYRSK